MQIDDRFVLIMCSNIKAKGNCNIFMVRTELKGGLGDRGAVKLVLQYANALSRPGDLSGQQGSFLLTGRADRLLSIPSWI